jgi:hypothetical protein
MLTTRNITTYNVTSKEYSALTEVLQVSSLEPEHRFDYVLKMKLQLHCLFTKFIKVPSICRLRSPGRHKMDTINLVILRLQPLEIKMSTFHCQFVIRRVAQPRSSKPVANQQSDIQYYTSVGLAGVNEATAS